MEQDVFLEAWLHNLQIVLEDTQNNIKKIEENEENNRMFAAVQIQLMEKWLQEEKLKPEVQEDLKGILSNVKNREEENAKQLKHLKVVEESTAFMIQKINEEREA